MAETSSFLAVAGLADLVRFSAKDALSMATPNRQDMLNLLLERKGQWRQRYGITRLGLFGSLARDEEGPDSDVDLCVNLDPPNPFCLVHFRQEVEQALQVPVYVISLWDRMNPALRCRIHQEGVFV